MLASVALQMFYNIVGGTQTIDCKIVLVGINDYMGHISSGNSFVIQETMTFIVANDFISLLGSRIYCLSRFKCILNIHIFYTF